MKLGTKPATILTGIIYGIMLTLTILNAANRMTSSTSNSNLLLLVTSMLVTCVTLVLGYHFLVATNVIRPAPVVSPGDRIVQILNYATAPPTLIQSS